VAAARAAAGIRALEQRAHARFVRAAGHLVVGRALARQHCERDAEGIRDIFQRQPAVRIARAFARQQRAGCELLERVFEDRDAAVEAHQLARRQREVRVRRPAAFAMPA
jgi:hypothetical protein